MTAVVRTISVSIERDWREVYDYAAKPESFREWAAGIGEISQEGDRWIAKTASGIAELRFVARNRLGVLDHWVRLPEGAEVYVPLRVLANGEGAEVVFTLFRLPGMTEEELERDAAAVVRDLATLKRLLES